MNKEDLFDEQIKLVFRTQRKKRRSHDSLEYEVNIIPLTVRACNKRIDKTLRINNNYAFLVSVPKWREIIATEFEGRKIDHEICEVVIPEAEKILSPYTFNNRKGMGSHAAINTLIEHIYEVSEGYTKPCRCIKLDFKGFFPNARWDVAEDVICNVIDSSHVTDETKAYLKWLTCIAVNCNPSAHCSFRTPRYLWDEHIQREKSIFEKEEGVGAAIGRLIWQTAMGLYINDIIKWLTDVCGIKVVCFVDDIVMVVPEEMHGYALSLIPLLRDKLKNIGVRLNENKFYDQMYYRGLEFLGSHIKPYRIHLNSITYKRAVKKIRNLNVTPYKDIDMMLSSFNSYSGLLKNRTDYKRLQLLKCEIDNVWWKWLDYDDRRKCLVYKHDYTLRERLNKKYNLKLKERKI